MADILLDLSIYNKKTFGAITQLNASQLKEVIAPFRVLLHSRHLEYTDNTPDVAIAAMQAFIKNGCNKMLRDETESLLSALFWKFENCINISQASQPSFIKVIRHIVMHGSISYPLMRDIMGKDTPSGVVYGNWYKTVLLSGLGLFLHVDYEERYSYYLNNRKLVENCNATLYRENYSEAIDMLFSPEDIQPKVLSEMPAGCKRISFEEDIQKEIHVMLPFHSAGKLVTPQEVFSPPKTLKYALRDDIAAESWFLPYSRRQMAVYAIGYYYSTLRLTETPSLPEFMKWAVKDVFKDTYTQLFQLLLPNLDGLTKTICCSFNAKPLYSHLLAFIKESGGQWFSSDGMIEPFSMHILATPSKKNDDIFRLNLGGDFADYKLRDRITGDYIAMRDPNRFELLDRPFVEGLMMWLLSVGILECAVGGKGIRHYNEIKAWRLTDAGRYALNITRKFSQVSVADVSQEFDVDDDNMIVTALRPESPFVVVLEQMAEHIGGNRYRLSASRLVQKAKSPAEVKVRVENFRNYICPSPGPKVEAELNRALIRSAASVPVDKNYVVVRINPEADGIVDFISSNEEIGEHTVLARDCMILIENSFYGRFVNLLLAAGYMI